MARSIACYHSMLETGGTGPWSFAKVRTRWWPANPPRPSQAQGRATLGEIRTVRRDSALLSLSFSRSREVVLAVPGRRRALRTASGRGIAAGGPARSGSGSGVGWRPAPLCTWASTRGSPSAAATGPATAWRSTCRRSASDRTLALAASWIWARSAGETTLSLTEAPGILATTCTSPTMRSWAISARTSLPGWPRASPAPPRCVADACPDGRDSNRASQPDAGPNPVRPCDRRDTNGSSRTTDRSRAAANCNRTRAECPTPRSDRRSNRQSSSGRRPGGRRAKR